MNEEEEMEIEPFKADTVAEYVDEIEKMFSNEPDGRKKTEHKKWKLLINDLIAECNKKALSFPGGVKQYEQLK